MEEIEQSQSPYRLVRDGIFEFFQSFGVPIWHFIPGLRNYLGFLPNFKSPANQCCIGNSYTKNNPIKASPPCIFNITFTSHCCTHQTAYHSSDSITCVNQTKPTMCPKDMGYQGYQLAKKDLRFAESCNNSVCARILQCLSKSYNTEAYGKASKWWHPASHRLRSDLK
jgi:hypothetical protein